MAGFIGFHLADRLLCDGYAVVGLDNLNNYYDVQLKKARLARLRKHKDFWFVKLDVADRQGMQRLFALNSFDRVVHLAAQAGVRYSIDHPEAYIDSNLVGFANLLEACRHNHVQHLLFASSSSVYGGNTKLPFSECDNVDHPVSLYAATKKSNELLAHAYAHLYDIRITSLRFFTVYGPWGRPDMACFLFTRAILEGKPIRVFNHGHMKRDFTYIDDVIEAIVRTLDKASPHNPPSDTARPKHCAATFNIYNIGRGKPMDLMQFIETLETALGQQGEKIMVPMQPGDIPVTYADTTALKEALGYAPSTSVEEGVRCFVKWYKTQYCSAIT